MTTDRQLKNHKTAPFNSPTKASEPTAPSREITIEQVRSEIEEAFKHHAVAAAEQSEIQAHIRSEIGFS